MMNRKPILQPAILIMTILGAALAWCCDLAAQSNAASTSSPKTMELIRDPHFQNGFNLQSPTPGKKVIVGKLQPPGVTKEPAWNIAQWHSRFDLKGAKPEKLDDGAIWFGNQAKAITLADEGDRHDLTLAIDTNPEYDGRARKNGEPWPHLLVQQEIRPIQMLKEFDRIEMSIDAKLLHNKRTELEGYTPRLHTAQLLLTLIVQDRNPQSQGYGDFIWLNVSLYDERRPFTDLYASQDTADPSAKMIYAPPSRTFTEKSMHDGDWGTIKSDDLLPIIRQGLTTAREKGYLQKSDNNGDFAVTSLILGWEVPGVNDVSAQIRDLRFIGHSK